MDDDRNRITKVRERRQRAGLTMAQLAVAADMSNGVLSRIENAESHHKLDLVGVGKFLSLAQVLRCSAADLYPALRDKKVSL